MHLACLIPSVIIDLAKIPQHLVPHAAGITTIKLAELSQGPHLAKNDYERAMRIERLQIIEAMFRMPLPFGEAAARRYGSLVALMVIAGRSSRARRNDLMIADTAAVHNLPLYTRNTADFTGLGDAVNILSV